MFEMWEWGRGAQRLLPSGRERACASQRAPQIPSEAGQWKGARLPATQAEGAKEEEQLRVQPAEASAAVGAPMWQCISQEPPGGSEAAHGADSDEPRKVSEKF